MNNNIVYRHRNPITNEIFYVGMGKEDRASNSFRRPKTWYPIVEQYGRPIVEVLSRDLSEDDAWELERFLIEQYGRMIDGTGPLTNISLGKWHAPETLKKMSEAGKKLPKIFGRLASEETKKKMSEKALARQKNPIMYKGVEYDSISAASRITGTWRKTIMNNHIKI